ncbi:MAG: dihydrodipicolinate synthase family protein [Pseudomonadales bacterium]
MDKEFKGVYPALITPMDSDGKLNESALRKVIEFNINAGVHGFWVAGGTGESVLLDDEENRRIAQIVSEESKGRIKNIMHVGTPTTARSAKLAEHAAKSGVEAICCVPPFFYRQSDDAIVEHYRVVASAADLPFFVYNLPQSTQVEITPDLMQKIKDKVPQLVGLKHSAPYIGPIRQFCKMGLCCMVGNSRLMLPALMMGASGCIDGPPGMAPEIFVDIWDSFQSGNFKQARESQEKGAQVGALVENTKMHAYYKAFISKRIGIDCGQPRPPFEGLTSSEKDELSKIMIQMKIKDLS